MTSHLLQYSNEIITITSLSDLKITETLEELLVTHHILFKFQMVICWIL